MKDQYKVRRPSLASAGSLSMGELVERSGVHRQTIHSYLREGLLPPPAVGAGTRNARYSDAHLHLLALVRELRDERGLSLEAIRRHLELARFDPEAARRALTGEAAPSLLAPSGPTDQRLTRAQLLVRAEAPESLLDALAEAGVLDPEPDDPERRYGARALAVLGAARRLAPQGLSAAALARLARGADSVAAVEVEALLADAGGLPDAAPLARAAELRHRDVGALVAAVRVAALRATLARLAEVGPRSRQFAEEAIYIPSPLFVRRHDLERILADVERAARRRPRDAAIALKLGRLLLGLGRYDDADRWLALSAQLAPEDAEAAAYLGLVRAVAGRMSSAVESCRRAVELAPRSSRARVFYASTLALQAAVTVGLDDPAEVLRQALAEAAQSRSLDEKDPRERMETLIARGRIFTVLPFGAEGHRGGVADLEEVLARTDVGGGAEGFDFPGSGVLYRMHALFYLGVNARQGGRSGAARAWLGECITLDPTSRFAERAYEILGELDRERSAPPPSPSTRRRR